MRPFLWKRVLRLGVLSFWSRVVAESFLCSRIWPIELFPPLLSGSIFTMNRDGASIVLSSTQFLLLSSSFLRCQWHFVFSVIFSGALERILSRLVFLPLFFFNVGTSSDSFLPVLTSLFLLMNGFLPEVLEKFSSSQSFCPPYGGLSVSPLQCHKFSLSRFLHRSPPLNFPPLPMSKQASPPAGSIPLSLLPQEYGVDLSADGSVSSVLDGGPPLRRPLYTTHDEFLYLHLLFSSSSFFSFMSSLFKFSFFSASAPFTNA